MTLDPDDGSQILPREVLSAQVKDRILQWILEGELAPGSRIVETRVARQLGVSQAPVREALRDLATLGVVDVAPYRGASVREPSRRELVEAMEVRGELEAMGARRAATRMTAESLEELRSLIGAMKEAARTGDVHEHAINNTKFHEKVMQASGNESLVWVWSMLEPLARTYFTASVAPSVDLGWLGDRHLAILEALEEGDPDRAAEVMRAHAREAEDLVMADEEPRARRAEAQGMG